MNMYLSDDMTEQELQDTAQHVRHQRDRAPSLIEVLCAGLLLAEAERMAREENRQDRENVEASLGTRDGYVTVYDGQ